MTGAAAVILAATIVVVLVFGSVMLRTWGGNGFDVKTGGNISSVPPVLNRTNPGDLPSGQPKQTNRDILLITIDTLRADHLSSYGYPKPTSPFIDGIAELRGFPFEGTPLQFLVNGTVRANSAMPLRSAGFTRTSDGGPGSRWLF